MPRKRISGSGDYPEDRSTPYQRAPTLAGMTGDLFLRCQACGWCHILADPDAAAGERCYRCNGAALAVIDRAEFRRSVPAGVTLLPRSHPDIERVPGRFAAAHGW
jgi:hypothetical protein